MWVSEHAEAYQYNNNPSVKWNNIYISGMQYLKRLLDCGWSFVRDAKENRENKNNRANSWGREGLFAVSPDGLS